MGRDEYSIIWKTYLRERYDRFGEKKKGNELQKSVSNWFIELFLCLKTLNVLK